MAMDKIIIVEPKEVLCSRDNLAHLSASVCRVPISRREVLNYASDTLYDFLDWGGSVWTPEGEELEIYAGVFDDIHGEDLSGIWISELRKKKEPKRNARATLIGRLRWYDAVFRIQGRPVTPQARRCEVAQMREVLHGFNRVWRARYVQEIRKLRREYKGQRVVHYGAAVRRLRLRFRAELSAWQREQSC
jgi:hypothetical protein